MDETLADYSIPKKDVRERLWNFKASEEKLGNTKAAILANAYIIFEQYLRHGNGKGVSGFSELKAGRQDNRKNRIPPSKTDKEEYLPQ
jgi:hypothetical protein